MIRVAFFAAFHFHTPILAPIRDAVGAAAETWLGDDRRAAVAFRPHAVVMAALAARIHALAGHAS